MIGKKIAISSLKLFFIPLTTNVNFSNHCNKVLLLNDHNKLSLC